jgi:hypothetical protein
MQSLVGDPDMNMTLALAQQQATPLDEHEAPSPLQFERRYVDRWPVQGVATAICLSSENFGKMHELSMLDYSFDGLGAISNTVLEPGMNVSIGFQSPGYPAKRGTVLRCIPCGNGYRVAIQFEARMAA